jgi:hypothetical protein
MKTRNLLMFAAIAASLSVTVASGAASAAAASKPAVAAVTMHPAFRVIGNLAKKASLPTSDITGSGTALSFSPATLSATWSGPVAEDCTSALAVIRIKNTTTTAQTVVLSGTTMKLQPNRGTGVCFFGTGTGFATLHLQADVKAKLKVNLS